MLVCENLKGKEISIKFKKANQFLIHIWSPLQLTCNPVVFC